MTSEEHALSLLCGDAITQSQWLDVNRRSHDSPELRLVVAVLEGALRDAGRAKPWHSSLGNQRRIDEAAAWFASGATGAFSFLWVAEFLGFDAGAFRTALASKAVIVQRRRSPSQGYREKIAWTTRTSS